jgi:hypothetical protein
MSTMEPDEGAQSEQPDDAPRFDKTEAANPADAPRWDELDTSGQADAPRWDEVQESASDDTGSVAGPDDPDTGTDS